ncbi:MAG: hypothetical protein ACE5HT_10880 [Gemmatimonadales bacterium]
MSVAPVQDLRRIADAVGQLHGHTVEGVEIRSDCRLLRISLEEGRILLISVLLDEAGKPRLDVDLLTPRETDSHGQLEVSFDPEDAANE